MSLRCSNSFFIWKIGVVFFPDFISCKIARNETLLKTTSDSAVLFKYGMIPEQNMKQSTYKNRRILGASVR
jgi:hypothetical protein